MRNITITSLSNQVFKMKCFAFLACFLLGGVTMANNLAIGVPVVDQTAKTVTFTVSWDNSWNIVGTGVPNNWDAVWLFIKWKDCSQSSATAYTHGTLSGLLADRTIPAGLQVMSTVNLNGTLNSGAVNTLQESAVQAGVLDFTDGIIVRRATVGTGSTGVLTIVLKVPGLPAPAVTITTSVFGIEMAYVPQGDFTLGDGDGVTTASNSFTAAAVVNTSGPMTINNAFETGASTFFMSAPAATPITVAAVPAAWPKGQCGFYMMKYEITEGAYADFLNTLGSGQQPARLPGSFTVNRNALSQVASPYTTTRPDRAQNFLSFNDVGAYLDWSCLRFATETEFEKACRGNGSTRAELAWGNLVIANPTTFAAPGTENGTETVTSGNCTYNNPVFTNGDAGTGPTRAGIYATAVSTRQTAGASFYGIMELSGNVRESVIGMHSTGASNIYIRQQGDGYLTAAGNFDPTTWPPFGTALNPANAVPTNIGGCTRGGGWNNAATECQVSSRYYMIQGPVVQTQKNSTDGGRGVR